MGHGIAHACALAGIDTVLYDVDLGAVDTGLKLIRKDLDETVSVGPLRLADLVGLDVRMDAATYLHEASASAVFRPPELLERMVQEGKLRKKSGEGFFSWVEDGESDEC